MIRNKGLGIRKQARKYRLVQIDLYKINMSTILMSLDCLQNREGEYDLKDIAERHSQALLLWFKLAHIHCIKI